MIRVGDPATPKHGEPVCLEFSRGTIGFACTEPKGHEGQHVACGVTKVLAVWESEG